MTSPKINDDSRRRLNIIWEEIDVSAGGIQQMAYYWTKHMSKYYEVSALSGRIKSGYTLANVTYMDIRSKLDWKIQSYKWLSRNSDKLSISLSFTWWGAFNCMLVYLRYGTPYFTYCHGDEIYFKKRRILKGNPLSNICYNLRLIFKQMLCKQVLKRSDAVFCNSRYTMELAKKTCDKAAYQVLHPGIEADDNADMCSATYANPYILTLCRIERQKGIQNVLMAMPVVLRSHPELTYIVAGRGTYMDELIRLTDRLGIAEHVRFVGYVTEEEKQSLMKGCSVFILSSLELPETAEVEGFGIVYLEANQYGKYVIGNSYGGVSDAILDGITGKLLTKHTTLELSEAILDVLDHKDQYYSDDLIHRRQEWSQKHDYPEIIRQAYQIMANYI